MESESSFDSCDSIANPMPGKIHILELLPKMVLANQLIFLFADKHQSFLQVSASAVNGCVQACPKYPK